MPTPDEPLQEWKPGGLASTIVGLLGWACVVAILTMLGFIDHDLQAIEQLLRARSL